MRRLAVLAFIGLVTACGGDDRPDGVGNGASASTALRYDTLSSLTNLTEAAVDGVVREVVEDAGSQIVTMDIQQTLWTQSGVQAPSGTLQFRHASDGTQNAALTAGDEVIVFLVREDGGAWAAHGGASSLFRVDGGVVTPALEGGVSLPANTDVAGFVAMLQQQPEPSSDYGASSDYGYSGGGSY